MCNTRSQCLPSKRHYTQVKGFSQQTFLARLVRIQLHAIYDSRDAYFVHAIHVLRLPRSITMGAFEVCLKPRKMFICLKHCCVDSTIHTDSCELKPVTSPRRSRPAVRAYNIIFKSTLPTYVCFISTYTVTYTLLYPFIPFFNYNM